VTVTDGTGCGRTQEVTIARPLDCVVTALRINAGGAAYTAGNGNLFMADQYFTAATSSTYTNTTAGIAGTDDDLMYQSERGANTDRGTFAYNIPVKNGNHSVILHFAEIFSGTVGRRIMNVSIEGTQRLTNFDIAAAVGFRTATTRQFDVNVKDGMLSITFSATADRPKVSAIEVISSFPPAGVNQLPTANAGADLTITLPANAVTVTGSGTDNDGTIAAFGWAPVTTPVTATVATPNAATTQIGGLTAAVRTPSA
jgi:hypothetical protein